MKLNGWQRLWVLLSTIYLALVTSYVIFEFQKSTKDIQHEPEFYAKLSKKSAAIICPTTHEEDLALGISKETKLPYYLLKAFYSRDLKEWRSSWAELLERTKKLNDFVEHPDDYYQTIEIPNGHVIKFLNKSSDEDILAASQEYWRIVEQKSKETKFHLLLYAFLFWIIPCTLLYFFGLSIHWIYKGFKNTQ